jgi:alpha-L-fucosidase
MKSKLLRNCYLFLLLAAGLHAETDRDTRMAWWREARFGMFVTYGLYSSLAGTWDGKPVPGDHNFEHAQRRVHADTHTYAAASIPGFRPKQDFATAWAKLARQAGCSYVVFTTKFHDGFALHDSKLTQFDAGDVLNRDLVREITAALRKEGLRVGFYHSVIDWHHPQYDYSKAISPPYPKDGMRMSHGPRDHNRYVGFLHGQVDELMSNYGKVDIVWWDYSAFGFDGDEAWKAADLMAMCRKKQPQIIMNNRLFRRPEAGFSMDGGADISRPLDEKFGDFGTPEQHVPDVFDAKMDWETCMTMNNTWGFSEHDHNWKSPETIIRNLIDIASKGGNYLLNIGPTGDGSIPQPSIDIMSAIGKWMDTNAEAIRGTSKSPLGIPAFDGRMTAKGKVHYLHLFSRPASGTISVALSGTKATLLDGGKPLVLTRDGQQTVIQLPPTLPDPIATVIRLE